MKTRVEKTRLHRQPLNNTGTVQTQRVTSTTETASDFHPDTIIQNKLQQLSNTSPQVYQLKAIQALANNRRDTSTTGLQAIADSHAPQRTAGNKSTGLPAQLKSGIEGLSGYSMDDVKVHYNSDKPAQLKAHAFTQGTQIHIAQGQTKHLPHEAWHVVQQKQGRVQPTLQMKDGITVNNDKTLEREADVMGEKAVSTLPRLEQPQKHLTAGKVNLSSAPIVQRVIEDDAEQQALLEFLQDLYAQTASLRQINELHKELIASTDNLESAKVRAEQMLKEGLAGGLDPVQDTEHGLEFPQYPLDAHQIGALGERRITGTRPDGNCTFAGFIESTGLGIGHEALRALANQWVQMPLNRATTSHALALTSQGFTQEMRALSTPGQYGPLGLTALQHMFMGVVRIDVMTAGGHLQQGPGNGIPITLVQVVGAHSHFYGTTPNIVDPQALLQRLTLLRSQLEENHPLSPSVQNHVTRSSELVSEIIR